MHFSPERARAVRRAPACPEWSVASDAEGGSGERGGPERNTVQPGPTLSDPTVILVDSERARPPRSPGDGVSRAHGAKRRERPPTPQAPQARGAQRGSRERSEREQARRSFAWSRDAERPRAFRCEVSTGLFRIQLSQEPIGRRSDPHAIDVAHIKVDRGCPKRVVLDENTVDNGSDGLRSILLDNCCHRFIKMGVVVISTRYLCSLEYEYADVVNRRVDWIPRTFTNVVANVGIGHEGYLVTVEVVS